MTNLDPQFQPESGELPRKAKKLKYCVLWWNGVKRRC